MKRMYNAILFKFTQNRYLMLFLANTDGYLLIENAGQADSFWGNGGDCRSGEQWNVKDLKRWTWDKGNPPNTGRGYNWLGLILMQVRDVITGNDFCVRAFGGVPFRTEEHHDFSAPYRFQRPDGTMHNTYCFANI